MIKAVVFDFDDTFVNTFATKSLAFQQLARELYGYELPLEKIQQVWGMPYKEMVTKLFEDIPVAIEDILDSFDLIRERFPAMLFDEVEETITQLSANVKLGIVSSAGQRVLYKDLDIIKLDTELFFHIQTAEDTNAHKPNPEVFEPILQKLSQAGIDRNSIAYVGDSINDYYAARDAGISFYALPDRTTPRKVFEDNGATILSSFNELVLVVEKS